MTQGNAADLSQPSTETLSSADLAAHDAASHIRTAQSADSDPSGDELLHRVKNPRTPQPRTLTSYTRPDTRRAMADLLRR